MTRQTGPLQLCNASTFPETNGYLPGGWIVGELPRLAQQHTAYLNTGDRVVAFIFKYTITVNTPHSQHA